MVSLAAHVVSQAGVAVAMSAQHVPPFWHGVPGQAPPSPTLPPLLLPLPLPLLPLPELPLPELPLPELPLPLLPLPELPLPELPLPELPLPLLPDEELPLPLPPPFVGLVEEVPLHAIQTREDAESAATPNVNVMDARESMGKPPGRRRNVAREVTGSACCGESEKRQRVQMLESAISA
jgi:hypothetical protein